MIDAVLCELEGVIVETAAPRQRAMMRAFAEEGLDGTSIEAGQGLSVRETIARALAGDRAIHDAIHIDLLALKANMYFATEAATGLTLAPGVIDTFTALHARTRLALVTRAEREVTDRILSLGGLDGVFEVIVTAGDVLEPKPHPEGHRVALERLTRRRPVRTALAIEDGLSGVRAAHAAGIPCIVVGALPAHEAIEAHAVVDGLRGQSLESLAALAGRDGARVA